MASTAADDKKRKGKRPLYRDEEVAYAEAAAAAAAEAAPEEEEEAEAESKPSSSSEEPEVEKQVVVVEEKQEQEQKEKRTLVLVAEDGVEVHISEAAARMSYMLRQIIEEDCAGDRIPTPNVYSDVLEIVVEYCEKHAPHYDPVASERDRHPFPPFPVELTPTASSIKPVTYVDPDPHGLKAWDKEFIQFDNSTLFDIILAADYLSIEDLLDLGTTAVADKIRGRTPEEIREILEIENDYTPEQEAEVRRENAWAFED